MKANFDDMLKLFRKGYFYLVTLAFCVWDVLVWSAYVALENAPEYCIYSDKAQRYDFLLDGDVPCFIDWSYFIKEPLLLSLVVYGVLMLPVVLITGILSCRTKSIKE